MTTALRRHLHLKPTDLEPLVGLSQATMARRAREPPPHTPAGAGAPVPRTSCCYSHRRSHDSSQQRTMSDSDVARQRDYYRATAATYHERHVGEQDEHGLALAVLMALARHGGVSGSFLDVGAGTGRAMQALAQAFPAARGGHRAGGRTA